jgi:hypothetical protein
VHRENGWNAVVGVFVFLIAIETGALHLMLRSWVGSWAAWLATALSISTIVWLVRDALALRASGVILHADDVELHIGNRWRARIPRAAIVAIEGPADDAVNISVLGANTVLRLDRAIRLDGPFGRTREARAIALSIDDRDAFIRALDRPPPLPA